MKITWAVAGALSGAERTRYDNLDKHFGIELPALMGTCSSIFIAQPLQFILIFFYQLKTALFLMFDFPEKYCMVVLLYQEFLNRERAKLNHQPFDLQSNALPLSYAA